MRYKWTYLICRYGLSGFIRVHSMRVGFFKSWTNLNTNICFHTNCMLLDFLSRVICRFFRIGSIILALHDVNDVFMETAKLSKYTGNEHAASTCFGFFAISWFLLRLIYFPFWVIRSSSHDAVDVFVLSKGYHSFLYYLLNTMLITLLIFHIYWGILIFFMVSRQLKNRGQVGEDIRSDSDNED
ncbi:hypothetical protein AMTRI_Chr04g247700 [Amborella trichopoda]